MANNFSTQAKIDKMLQFAYSESQGVLDKLDWQTDKFSPQENIGTTISVRRPIRSDVTDVALDTSDYPDQTNDSGTDLPGNAGLTGLNPITYSKMADEIVPLTVDRKFEVNLQYSLQDASFYASREQMYTRAVKPAMTKLVDKINKYMFDKIFAASGNAIDTAGNTADGYTKAIYEANRLLIARGGASDADSKSVVLNPSVLPVLGAGVAKNNFNAPGAGEAWKKGTVANFGGFDMYQSGLLGSVVKTSATVAVTSNPTALTKWSANGWKIALTVSAGTLAVGSKISFSDVNWVHINTGEDTGIAATFTVVSYAGGIATLKECAIPSGPAKNVTALPTTASTVTVLNAGTTAPSLWMLDNSIVAASPEVKIGPTINGRNINMGGLNVQYIVDHFSGTNQMIEKLVCYVGIAVPRPEVVGSIFDFAG